MEKLFKTCDLDLAAFLMLHDLKYVGVEKIKDQESNKTKIQMIFYDPRNIALDLNRIFIMSEQKKYREFLKFLLKEIHKELS